MIAMFVRFFFLMIPLVMLSSCVSAVRQHGYSSAGIKLWDAVKVGDSVQRVTSLLGDPTLYSVVDREGVRSWYYVSYKIQKDNPFVPKKYNGDSLQVDFDKSKVVFVKKSKFTSKRFASMNRAATTVLKIDQPKNAPLIQRPDLVSSQHLGLGVGISLTGIFYD